MSKTILITGASSGFGRDTAETLHRGGHTVYASMRGVQRKNREAAEALRNARVVDEHIDLPGPSNTFSTPASTDASSLTSTSTVLMPSFASAGVTEAFTTEQAKVIFDTNVIGLLRWRAVWLR